MKACRLSGAVGNIMDALKEDLRDNHRLKFNVDYSWTVKYGEIRIMCHNLFKDTISEVAKHHGVVVWYWLTY